MDMVLSAEVIGGICGIVLCIALLKKRAQIVLGFLVRAVLGAICLIFINDFFEKQGVAVTVGLNPFSLTTIGVLGTAGVILLYAIVASKFL